ncbi:MAG TPA: hypothetical protein VNC16_11160 [Solirubrobacterales bacterium]|jgi:hypothetical protein|nr:hypothetical protein [Solirubrobacterales bacterium]
MTTVVENEKSSGQRPDEPTGEAGTGLAAAERFDKVEADMREGFSRIDQDIRDLRHEVKAQGETLRGEIQAQGETLRGEIQAQGETLRKEMNAQGESLRGQMIALGDRLRDEMNTRLLALDASIKSYQRTMIGTIVAALLVNKFL